MKKILALLLAAVMCFSLVACGGNDNAEIIQEYKNRIADLETVIADLEAEIARISAGTEATEPDNTETEITEPEETEPEETEPQYETVEITLDNWQEYFEIVPTYLYLTNAFGEYSSLAYMYDLVIRDGYICDKEQSDVAIEFTYTYGSAEYTIDFENRTITYGEVTALSESSSRTRKLKTISSYAGDRSDAIMYYRYGFELTTGDYLYALQGTSDFVIVAVNISRVSGSICFYREN